MSSGDPCHETKDASLESLQEIRERDRISRYIYARIKKCCVEKRIKIRENKLDIGMQNNILY